MATGQLSAALRQIERLFTVGSVTGMNEGQLLDRFVSGRDEAAFAALMARHGPMVLGVCRQWLRDPNDVDDAFQATFLVLVRKADSLRQRDLLGNWLYGVASRVACRARAVASRRQGVPADIEDLASDRPAPPEPNPMLHEEVARLPDKYRVPIVLCYLEGLTHEEAADRLGWPVGTVKGRLARARDLLRSRLTRRGITLPSAGLAVQLGRDASAAVPAPLVEATARASAALAASQAAAVGLISAPVAVLLKGTLHAMTLSKLKLLALPFVLAGAVVTGAVVLADPPPGAEKGQTTTTGAPVADPTKLDAVKAVSSPPADPFSLYYGQDVPPQTKTLRAVADYNTRYDAALRVLSMFEAGSTLPDPDEYNRWSIRLLKAELDRTNRPEDRSPNLRDHLQRLKRMEERARSQPEAEGSESIASWKLLREQAERMLAEASAPEPKKDHAASGLPPAAKKAELDEARLNRLRKKGYVPPSATKAAVKAEPKQDTPPSTAKAQSAPGMNAYSMMMGVGGGGMGGGMGGMGGGMGGMGGGMGRMGGLNPAMGLKRMQNERRVEIAEMLPKVEEADKNPRTQQILKKLNETVSMSFANETPLEDVLKYIKSATSGPNDTYGIPIYVDPVGLNEAEKTMTSAVALDLEGVPLKTTLRLLLKQLGLAYCVKDGLLIISSVDGILQELYEFETAHPELKKPEKGGLQ